MKSIKQIKALLSDGDEATKNKDARELRKMTKIKYLIK
jgi:hypothetical protein